MLWLIWIAIILLTPILVGVNVWWTVRAHTEPVIAEAPAEQVPS